MTTGASSATPTLPSTDEEIWRYSRISELALGEFTPGALHTETVGADALRTASASSVALSGTIAAGVYPDVFAELNAQHSVEQNSVITLTIPRGTVVDSVVEIVHHLEADGIAAYPRLVIDAGENSEVTVIERFVSPDSVRSLVVPVLQITAAKSARVNYVGVNQLGTRAWQIAHQQSVGHRDSTIRVNTVALGGDYARVRAEVRLVEQGASAQQLALYFASGSQMHDFRSLQIHEAPRTYSDLLFKGAVGGHARSVYTGLIKIAKNASHAEAFQTNRNLTLGEGAWAESVPNLEIETNEVKCSHASTVGSIDDEQRFYLESRGVPPQVAERLIVFGFFNDVLDRLPRNVDVSDLRQAVADKLAKEALS